MIGDYPTITDKNHDGSRQVFQIYRSAPPGAGVVDTGTANGSEREGVKHRQHCNSIMKASHEQPNADGVGIRWSASRQKSIVHILQIVVLAWCCVAPHYTPYGKDSCRRLVCKFSQVCSLKCGILLKTLSTIT
jgi:hypothetical protein